MNFCSRRFNLYLLAATLGLLATGCALWHQHRAFGAVLRIHLESQSNVGGDTKSVSVMRSQPMTFAISTVPILTESDVSGARLVDSPGGGFSVEVTLEETGGWKLEQYTSSNPDRHLAIFAQWSAKREDGRWLAAPYITRRIAGGVLTFTPDASHEEAEKLVAALNVDGKRNAGSKDDDIKENVLKDDK